MKKIYVAIILCSIIGYQTSGIRSETKFIYRYKQDNMKFSTNYAELLYHEEGFMPQKYRDVAGLWTIGIGTLIDTAEEQYLLSATISKQEAFGLLFKDSVKNERILSAIASQIGLNQNQFDALGSFMYQNGSSAFKNSTLLKVIMKDPNNTEAIQFQFERWRYVRSKDKDGNPIMIAKESILNRRRREFAVYCGTNLKEVYRNY